MAEPLQTSPVLISTTRCASVCIAAEHAALAENVSMPGSAAFVRFSSPLTPSQNARSTRFAGTKCFSNSPGYQGGAPLRVLSVPEKTCMSMSIEPIADEVRKGIISF
jgi:hypothetical protein